jgi:hypothetical protein
MPVADKYHKTGYLSSTCHLHVIYTSPTSKTYVKTTTAVASLPLFAIIRHWYLHIQMSVFVNVPMNTAHLPTCTNRYILHGFVITAVQTYQLPTSFSVTHTFVQISLKSKRHHSFSGLPQRIRLLFQDILIYSRISTMS